ncbi:surface lipoprotein assembly modifier [Pseudooceanicola aestuarii]|uniref:surface lipoprotein assembly modifier n=1 Tax=Pseudooceanicola aestuarii TaxID=2697319 RepID=UPI0013D4B596|nr:surface lipoprotein assembly modifier [Pseudooceanicola aestuarii]
MTRGAHRDTGRAPARLAGVVAVALALTAPATAQSAPPTAPQVRHQSAPLPDAALIARAEAGQELSPQQMRRLAIIAVRTRQPTLADTLTQALLARDPADVDALILRARALRDLGRADESLALSRRAWALADSDAQSYTAAMTRAQALSSNGRRTMAQFWLRRAMETAPGTTTRNRALRDFRYLRARNPWATELRFGVSPSSNINNGSTHDRITIEGLPFELTLLGSARALSGTEIDSGLSTRYRLAQTGQRADDLLFRLSHRTYRLSEEARQLAPGTSGTDFSETTASLGYAHSIKLNDRGEEATLTALAGRSWYGGDPYGEFLRFQATLRKRPGPRAAVTGGASVEWRGGPLEPEAVRGQVSLGYSHALQAGARLGLYSAYTLSQSGAIRADFQELRAGASLSPAQAWHGLMPRIALDWRHRDYDRYSLSSTGRQDSEISATIEVQFSNLDYMGFNPVLSVETARTRSNLDLHDARRSGIGLTIRSAF